MDLHYSQTVTNFDTLRRMFYYLMDLHYSQTQLFRNCFLNSFTTLWIYTILKQSDITFLAACSFTTLWIYTILKLTS